MTQVGIDDAAADPEDFLSQLQLESAEGNLIDDEDSMAQALSILDGLNDYDKRSRGNSLTQTKANSIMEDNNFGLSNQVMQLLGQLRSKE